MWTAATAAPDWPTIRRRWGRCPRSARSGVSVRFAERHIAAPSAVRYSRHGDTTSRQSMIPRYSRPEMTQIWEPATRFRIWFGTEAPAAAGMAEIGVIPKEAAKVIWEKGSKAQFDVDKIDAIERVTKHDVIAFLTHLAEFVGPE